MRNGAPEHDGSDLAASRLGSKICFLSAFEGRADSRQAAGAYWNVQLPVMQLSSRVPSYRRPVAADEATIVSRCVIAASSSPTGLCAEPVEIIPGTRQMSTVVMATEQKQGPSTPLPAAKPRVDVSGSGADDTVFSPGVDQLLPQCGTRSGAPPGTRRILTLLCCCRHRHAESHYQQLVPEHLQHDRRPTGVGADDFQNGGFVCGMCTRLARRTRRATKTSTLPTGRQGRQQAGQVCSHRSGADT